MERGALARALRRLASPGAPEHAALPALTTHEVKVIALVVQGLRNKEIARRLCITEGTVKSHLHSVYKKLGVSSRVALAVLSRNKEPT
jgi:DNA-binding NarL/FixJ family response regulator